MTLQPRKLKVDMKFQPLSRDAGDEFYPNGIFEFNITKMLTFIKANPHIFQQEEVAVTAVRKHPHHNFNESAIRVANIAEPIILAEIAPNRFNVIDGNHRLEKAYRDGKSKILAFRVLPEKHVAFLTSRAAYEEYVKYWNSKLTETDE